MANDITRDTFRAPANYRQVLKQQGRMDLDADWNEQTAVNARRDDTGARDIIGHCGGPVDSAGFGPGSLAGLNFSLTAGRYYVDGFQAELHAPATYQIQPDLPNPPALATGLHVAYLDVWERHITVLHDPTLAESALGGPDTATRVRTLAQVRTHPLGLPTGTTTDCALGDDWLDDLNRPTAARLTATTPPPPSDTDPCLLPPGSGFTGLENQLYRVEILHSGSPAVPAVDQSVSAVAPATFQVTVSNGAAWTAGNVVEFASTAGPRPVSQVALIVLVAGNVLTLSVRPENHPAAAAPRIRLLSPNPGPDRLSAAPGLPTYAWCRDNGSVGTRVVRTIPGDARRLQVESLGPDEPLGIRRGHLVELTDDFRELNGLPGVLAEVVDVDPADGLVVLAADVITPAWSPFTATGIVAERNPRLRRWLGVGVVRTGTPVALELGIRVEFSVAAAPPNRARFENGQFWQIPARTATPDAVAGRIEWPEIGGAPAVLPPRGITHHVCRLGVVDVTGMASPSVVRDCRCLYDPLSSPQLRLGGGDGQEVMPNTAALDRTVPASYRPLPFPIVVHVNNAHCHDRTVVLRLETPVNHGFLRARAVPANPAVPTPAPAPNLAAIPGSRLLNVGNPVGELAFDWYLDPVTDAQEAYAVLVATGRGLPDAEISPRLRFRANLSVARQVAFEPPAGCATLQTERHVQAALVRLAGVARLEPVGGDGQDVLWGADVPEPLVVRVVNACGPVAGATVQFTTGRVAPGTSGTPATAPTHGLLAPAGAGAQTPNWPAAAVELTVVTDAQGYARCWWRPDAVFGVRTATAVFDNPVNPHLRQAFTFTTNVTRPGGGCCVVVRPGQTLLEAIRPLIANGACIRLCLLASPTPYDADLDSATDLAGAPLNTIRLEIEGCGGAAELQVRRGLHLLGFEAIALRDVALRVRTTGTVTGGIAVQLAGSGGVQLDRVRLTATHATVQLLSINRSAEIAVTGSQFLIASTAGTVAQPDLIEFSAAGSLRISDSAFIALATPRNFVTIDHIPSVRINHSYFLAFTGTYGPLFVALARRLNPALAAVLTHAATAFGTGQTTAATPAAAPGAATSAPAGISVAPVTRPAALFMELESHLTKMEQHGRRALVSNEDPLHFRSFVAPPTGISAAASFKRAAVVAAAANAVLGSAIVIADNPLVLRIEECTVIGNIRLHGRTGDMPEASLAAFARAVHTKQLSVSGTAIGEWWFTANILWRVVLDAATPVDTTGTGPSTGVRTAPRRVWWDRNVFEGSRSAWLSAESHFSGNSWEPIEPRAGWVIAQHAVYLGNTGHPSLAPINPALRTVGGSVHPPAAAPANLLAAFNPGLTIN
jgi:hypothetical protein